MSSTTTHSAAPPPGIYTPLVTFFDTESELDLEAIKAHALRIAQGGAGLVIQGSNGEAVHLDSAERQLIIKTVRQHLVENDLGDVTIIAGCGAPSARETLKLTREAAEAGAGYALVLPPSYWAAAMTKPVLIAFFEQVADASPIPILIYNFPLVSNGVNIDSDTLIHLSKHRNIVECKLTCGNIGNLHRAAAHTSPETFAVMAGKGEFLLHGLVGGATGCIAALVNIAPKAHVAVYKAYKAGDLKRAKELQDLLSDADLAQQKLGVSGLKLAVSKFYGYGNGLARSPLPAGNESAFSAQKETLERLVELENSL